MVHAVHTVSASHSIQSECRSDQTQRTHRIALSALTSLALFTVVPWEVSLPLSACLLTWACLDSCTRFPNRSARIIIQETPHTPVIIDARPRKAPIRYYPILTPPPIYVPMKPRPVAPIPPPVRQVNTPTAPRHVVQPPPRQEGIRADVGVRTHHIPIPVPTPQPPPAFQQGMRAGVGVRTPPQVYTPQPPAPERFNRENVPRAGVSRR